MRTAEPFDPHPSRLLVSLECRLIALGCTQSSKDVGELAFVAARL
jgi:hypothetical protein